MIRRNAYSQQLYNTGASSCGGGHTLQSHCPIGSACMCSQHSKLKLSMGGTHCNPTVPSDQHACAHSATSRLLRAFCRTFVCTTLEASAVYWGAYIAILLLHRTGMHVCTALLHICLGRVPPISQQEGPFRALCAAKYTRHMPTQFIGGFVLLCTAKGGPWKTQSHKPLHSPSSFLSEHVLPVC